MLKSNFLNTRLTSPELLEKQSRAFEYLDSLGLDDLLFPFREEAGRTGALQDFKGTSHGGWDNPLCQIRGTFTGHWLSAQANRYVITRDARLKATLDYVVTELSLCQEDNGGEWVFPIPEKYLLALKRGKHFWAPQYVCQKVLSGLLAVYQSTGNAEALEIFEKAATWFLRYTEDCDQAAMQALMDFEETGAMLELWANAYAETRAECYRTLMEKYTRYSLLTPLLAGRDILTNMHANTTLPEVAGFARAYEVMGRVDYRQAVEAYWEQAIESRGLFASGGQTSGEVWTPKGRQRSRLGEMTQEHCTVYNSVRLADYLYRWTGAAKYADFIEKNIHNGILAQTFWQSRHISQLDFASEPEEGIVSYYLPLAAGSQKQWGDRLNHFWCCHCTAIEANTSFQRWLSYIGVAVEAADSRASEDYAEDSSNLSETDSNSTEKPVEILISQLFSQELSLIVGGVPAKLNVRVDTEFGDETIVLMDRVKTRAARGTDFPVRLELSAERPVDVVLSVRLPAWSREDFQVVTDLPYKVAGDYVKITLEACRGAQATITLQKKLSTHPLADNPDVRAFLDGPVLLAGLINEERTLFAEDTATAEDLLIPHDERIWGDFQADYQLTGQPVNFIFKPIKAIGKERYTVYFPIEKRRF